MAKGGFRENAGMPRRVVTLRVDVSYGEKLAILARKFGISAPRRGSKAAQRADVESAVVAYLIDRALEQVHQSSSGGE